ncbi:penicillin-binding protein 2 [Pseudoteredinibacter isoporae]|uniref:Peptidoglycan D,D-transpeptidase MrdA n=1 Tax=Pseudoteredinibacter isoporae TaxID=570281 RepID=A0A7X0JVC3_9GAMM|nr:penicillin-binding protein 2 [Pseudoteredinibacter isoporae]MBB6522950.1 penicillin-binding protein 2 [Pseudoteredinibacter isoporae]NHO88474.1 penicillin-binding protein 2 [Pseudoteredinibacter isoporae]NIB22127.1 penicillin-binding protein 2 [Pseudoteredinibacter isoporae]
MSEHLRFKDHYNEARIFFRRAIIVAGLIIALVIVLIARLYTLQVVEYQTYVTQSDRNRVQVQPLPPTRGLIYDRRGELLAENRPSYTLSIVKEQVESLDTTLRLLGQLVDISEDELEDFDKRLKRPKRRRRPYEPIPLRYLLDEEEIAKIAVNEYRLKGVVVEAQLVRYYPQKDLFAHNVGYVGRINERELKALDSEEYSLYNGTDSIGKIGLEKQYEKLLLGEVGYQQVETNARGRVLRVLERTDPTPGENLKLFLDAQLQRKAVAALGGRRGAVVAIEIDSGGVLAMVSAPSYDPNLFVTGISFKNYKALNESPDLPLFNRAIQGGYPPGSTLKPMLALGGLEANIIDEHYSVRDPGFYQLEGEERRYRDWKKRGHGHRVALKQAVAESCDVYYYDLAFRMGIDRMHSFGDKFGLGERTGVDVPSERSGLWPSRQWKRGVRGLPWFPGDSLNMGIGQGFVLTTPLQLASMTATMASKGIRRQPRLVQRVGEEELPDKASQVVEASEKNWALVMDAMEEVVHGQRGTAKSIARKAHFRMGGKTGTAQVVGIAQDAEYDSEALAERQRDHALFVGYAPADDPKIAVAVIVENGEKSSSAAKIARVLFDEYLLHGQLDTEPSENATPDGDSTEVGR